MEKEGRIVFERIEDNKVIKQILLEEMIRPHRVCDKCGFYKGTNKLEK